jgi:hypothetical protein
LFFAAREVISLSLVIYSLMELLIPLLISWWLSGVAVLIVLAYIAVSLRHISKVLKSGVVNVRDVEHAPMYSRPDVLGADQHYLGDFQKLRPEDAANAARVPGARQKETP